MAEEPKEAAATSMIAAIALRLTARAILGNRFAASLFHSIRGKLTDLEDSLIKVIASGRLDQVTQSAAIRNRKGLIVNAATDEITGAYQDITRLVADDLDALVPVEIPATRKIMTAEAQGLGVDFFASAPTTASLNALDAENMVGGLSIADLWEKQEQQLVAAFTREMNLGVQAGETIDGLVKRVTGGGTPTAPVKGIMPGQINNAKAIADSSVHATQNNARNSVYEANSDLFDIITHLSVLDNKTSLICLARAGMSWDAVTKAPIKPNRFPFAIPPLHVHCRSILIPNLSIAGDLSHLDANHFIKSLSPTELQSVLGPGRAALFLDGKISISQLVDQSDRPLTLVELASL